MLACSLSAVQSAYAGLGGAPMTTPRRSLPRPVQRGTVPGGASAFQSAASSIRLRRPTPCVKRRSATARSCANTSRGRSVFGIAWHGPQMPDLTICSAAISRSTSPA